MVRMRHKTRRDGTITIGATPYELDSDGVIECTEEHARKLARMWERLPAIESPAPVVTEPPADPDPPAELDVEPTGDASNMSKGDLLQLARELGLEIDRRTSKLELVAMIRDARKE